MASSPTKTERFIVFDPTTSTPEQPQEGVSEVSPNLDDSKGTTTCCKCPVCTCGPECSCPKGEAAGCDPCATFLKGEATTTSSRKNVPGTSGASALAANALVEPPPQPQTKAGALDDPARAVASQNLDLDVGSASCSTATASLPTASSDRGSTSNPTTTTPSPTAAAADDEVSSAETKSPPGFEAQQGLATGAGGDSSSGGAPGGNKTAVTPEEQKALRKERRERARNAKRAQTKRGGRFRRYEGKRRWATNGEVGDEGKKENAPDAFDEWLGVKLKAWRDGEVAPKGANAVPPEESGVLADFDFDPSQDELAFPSSLSPLQRGQVHGWAMQLALFHASSGEDTERHVIISKTGIFKGKVLTRGGRTWYKEGVIAPVVERFALQEGNEEAVKDIVASLQSFHESVQLHEPGFAKWLRTHVPGSLDGSDLAQAQEAFANWPLLHHVELEYVDTPEGLASLVRVLDSCQEYAFDLEAHTARTHHGLTCLLQISTEHKDYVVDPLAEGMWDNMPLLRGPFGDSSILKIGHSIRSCDVPSLYRDFGIVVVNAFDTEEAVHALGEKHSGLARVLESAGVKELHDIAGLKQSMQACDWRERPLSAEKLVYARCDSHYLIPLWRLLRARLLAADTVANREDAQEERELQEIKRRLEKEKQKLEKEAIDDQLSTGSPGLETEFDLASASPGFPLVGKVRKGSGSISPVPMPGEPWTSEWDDPEDCHRRERSRSGSSFRSGLGSISESDFGGGANVRSSFIGVDGALQASFQEGDAEEEEGGQEGQEEEEEEAEASDFALMNGNDNDLSFADLGENLMEEDEHEEQEDASEEDEDEDMWDGWGQDDPSEQAKADALDETPSVSNDCSGTTPSSSLPDPVFATIPEAAATSNELASPIPKRVNSVPDTDPDALSSVSPPLPSEAGETRVGARRGGGRTGRREPEASPQPEQHVLLTDGVRLMWKSLSRAQLATSVLWHPAAPAKRKDSHNERHFRTAVQRLKPPRWTEVNVKVYEEIYLWRDRTARRVDDGATYVCPGDTLIDVALALPTTLDALRRVSAPLSPVLGHGDTPEAVELVGVLRVALGLPEKEPQEAETVEKGTGTGAVNDVPAVSEAVGGVVGEAVGEAIEETVDGDSVGGDDGSAAKAGVGLLLALSMATLAVLIAFVKRRNS